MEGKVGNQATLFHGVFQLSEVRNLFVSVDRTTHRPTQGLQLQMAFLLYL